MKRPGVRSVTFQLVILFAAVLALSQIVNVGLRYGSQRESLSVLEGIRISERIATIVQLMERTAPAERNALAAYFNSSTLRLNWREQSRVPVSAANSAESERLLGIVRATLGTPPGELRVMHRPGRVGIVDGDELFEGTLPEIVDQVADELDEGPSFLISAQLSDGSWVNIAAAYAETLEFWSFESALIAAAMVVAIVALAIWAIRRLTHPFKQFAQAAQRLGTDVNAPPLDEGGPTEVRLAVDAFNEMQTRIRRFVEDRTQMLAAISHDLRTPITRARLRAEFVEDDGERARMIADFDEMERMIASVLDFAKADASAEPTERVDIVALLQRICDEMVDRGFDAQLEAHGHRALDCRPLAMRRCFTNLIENAVKYGGRARVDIEPRGDGTVGDGTVGDGSAGDRRHGTGHTGARGTGDFRVTEIAVHVDDDGPGIPEDRHEQAFRPFDRLERSRSRDGGGSGLGLTVARTIARAHGGDVVLANRPGGGLRATVILPVGN